jgi:HSP20 family protein
MALVRFDPFRQMQDTMNQLFDRRWTNPRWEDVPVLASWAPPVDIREEKGEIHLTAELPGVDLKDIDISIENNVLTLRGERRVEKDIKEDSYHWRERSYGAFRRTFTLPTTVDRDKIKATFKDGLLQVVLPPKPESMPKQIAVHSAA